MVNYYNKDLYKILGLNFDCDLEDIKTAYRRLVITYHPDVAGKDADEVKFKEIKEAYEILSDEINRRKYDALHGFYKEKIKLKYEQQNKDNLQYREFINKAKQNINKTTKNSEAGNKSFSGNINNTLDNLFGNKAAAQTKDRTEPPKNGDDIYLDLVISTKEALAGTERKVNILHTVPCPKCQGRKFINETACEVCYGEGSVSSQKKINVKIPKNIRTGTKIRVKGEGNKGLNGGLDGDLYLVIEVKKDPSYKIDGLDIHYTLPVTPSEAVLGAEIYLNITGVPVTVNIPPMSSSGFNMVLQGMGLSNKTQTKQGDFIITVNVVIPSELSEEEKELYIKLSKYPHNDIRKEFDYE